MAVDLPTSAALREQLDDEGHYSEWPAVRRVQRGYPPEHVRKYCVEDEHWQRVRLSMKNMPTHQKLQMLMHWWERGVQLHHYTPYMVECQIGNYLGALRRGGQLNDDNQVRRYK